MKAISLVAACIFLGGSVTASARVEPDPDGAEGAPGAAKQPASPGGVTDPIAFVRQVYTPAPAGRSVAAFNGYSRQPEFSPRLRALFADDERYANGEVGRLAFNPYTGAQDDDVTQVSVTAEEVEGAADRRVVTAAFRNMGAAQTVRVYFERIGGRWYVDDIASNGRAGASAQEPWTLSLILRYGH